MASRDEAVEAPPRRPDPPLPQGVPDTKVGHELAWVIDLVTSRGGEVDPTELTQHLSDRFLATVPPPAFVAVAKKLAEDLDALTITQVEAPADGALVVRASSTTVKLVITLRLDAEGRIDGLLFAPDLAERPKTWAEAEAALSKLAPQTSVLVASVTRGACKPIKAIRENDQLAIGSTFKLYVLLAVVDRILAGTLRWDTPITVRDAWKSLPSGITQDDPPGTTHTVRELAERMIALSDNTATDHLLLTVGRASVEAALKSAKHSQPARNVPFLTTRDMFALKLVVPAADVDAYVALSPAKKRARLDGPIASTSLAIDEATAAAWTSARRIDTLEWFANANDLCKVMATLAERAADPEAAPLLEILAAGRSPGALDAAVWPYAGYKGGSEPGVLNMTFLLRRDDDAWIVVSVGLNGPSTIDAAAAAGVAFGIIDLAAEEARRP